MNNDNLGAPAPPSPQVRASVRHVEFEHRLRD